MKRFRIVGLCLAAIFALSAFAATASAETPPEVGRCLKKAAGKFKNSTCTVKSVPGEEKFEWYPAYIGGVLNKEPGAKNPKLAYKSKNKEGSPPPVIQLESVSGAVIKATGQTATGEVTGEKTNIAQNIIFTGVEFKGFKCKSTKPAATNEGEVKVEDLNGNINYEKKNVTEPQKSKTANRFVPKSGTTFTEFKCSLIPVVVRGAVLNPVSSNKMLIKATVKFAGSKGHQKPEKFEGGPKETLESSIEGGPFEQSDQVLTTVQTNEEKLEISTVQ